MTLVVLKIRCVGLLRTDLVLLEYSCWDISMWCSVVHCYIGPLLYSRKSTVLPTKAEASTKVAMNEQADWGLNLSTSHDVQWNHQLLIRQIQRATGSAVSLTLRREGCVVNTEDVVLFWGSEMWKGLYRKVCEEMCVCGGSSDWSISRICTDNKNRRGCVQSISSMGIF